MYLKASTIAVDDALPHHLLKQVGGAQEGSAHLRRNALTQSPVTPWGARSTALSGTGRSRSDQQTRTSRQVQGQTQSTSRAAKLLDGFRLLKLAGVSLPEDARSASCVGERFAGVESADLPFFTSLERLVLNECTGLRLEMFSVLSSLETLSLSSCGLADTGSLEPGSFPQLRQLNVSHNNLSNSSIRAIAKLPRLEILDLSSNDLSHVPTELVSCCACFLSTDFSRPLLRVSATVLWSYRCQETA